MSVVSRTRRKKNRKWENRGSIIGVTVVVCSLAMFTFIRGLSLKEKEREYRIRLENVIEQVHEEEERAKSLEEERVYVQTKQYIEKMAKQKLGLVKPDEILLKPSQH